MNISSIKEIGGANSKVYLFRAKNGKKYIVKRYFSSSDGKKERLAREFDGLKFLWNKGIRCVPEPEGQDKKNNFAVYEYIEGGKIKKNEIGKEEIDKICRFLKKLASLRAEKEAGKIPCAAEACFSLQEIIENLNKRLINLISLPNKNKIEFLLYHFLSKEFTPVFEEIVVWCKQNLKREGVGFSAELDQKYKTLSPSDFGFHNAIRRKNGEIVFLDFEYFGWDDPAKMISDFLLHPKGNIKTELKQRFVNNMLSVFKDDKTLTDRLKVYFPLFKLKWCLIILNEFIPEDFQKRQFAGKKKLNRAGVLRRQFRKAKKLFAQVKAGYKDFPYEV